MYRFEELKQNSDLRQKILKAMKIRQLIREWFFREGFDEIETPSLVRFPGQEPYLYPFEVVVKNESDKKSDCCLITSPEYAHKKLLAAGLPKIFEMARCFRNNEPVGGFHNPEFTMLEWYRSDASYEDIMKDVEQLVFFVSERLSITRDFKPPWERLSVKEAFARYAKIDLENELDRPDFEDWFFKTFLSQIELKLGQGKPTILYDYPACFAALASLKLKDERYAERFEVYVKGVELANAFSELTDATLQKQRFLAEQKIRKDLKKPVYPIDEEFLAALAAGPKTSSGIALGVDRLAMVLLDAKALNEVLFFPY